MGEGKNKALAEARAERDKFQKDAATYKKLYESQQGYNKQISERLGHSERLVKTLLDALADKYHPIPTNINLSVAYRVADPETEPTK